MRGPSHSHKFPYQLFTFRLGNKLRRRNCINQNLKLWNTEVSVNVTVACRLSTFFINNDIEPAFSDHADIIPHRFHSCGTSFIRQLRKEIGSGNSPPQCAPDQSAVFRKRLYCLSFQARSFRNSCSSRDSAVVSLVM